MEDNLQHKDDEKVAGGIILLKEANVISLNCQLEIPLEQCSLCTLCPAPGHGPSCVERKGDVTIRTESTERNNFSTCNKCLHGQGNLNCYMSAPLSAVLVPPSISFSAGYSTFLIGEPVYLQCQAPTDRPSYGYRFYKNEQEVQNMVGSSGKEFRIYLVNIHNAGSYTCVYWVSDSRGLQTSEHSSPVSLTVLDQPHTPELVIKPSQALYFVGESVTLLCHHPHTTSRVSYIFYKDGTEFKRQMDSMRPELNFPILSTKDSGIYDCKYWLLGHQRKVTSSNSQSQKLTVTALSAAPSLNFLPSFSTFILGENLSLECVAPSPIPVTLYRLYKDGRELLGFPKTLSGKHALHNVTKVDEGEYTCMYWSTKSKREIPSTQSIANKLHVIAPLLPPLLSLDPPNGRVSDGENVTLFCTSPIHYERITFHFLNDKEEILGVATNRTEKRTSITILVHRSNSSVAKYFCQYTAHVKGRSLLSPRSAQSEIIVINGSMLWMIIIGVVAGIVVFIIMIVLFYWVLLARKNSPEGALESKPSSEVTSSPPVTHNISSSTPVPATSVLLFATSAPKFPWTHNQPPAPLGSASSAPLVPQHHHQQQPPSIIIISPPPPFLQHHQPPFPLKISPLGPPASSP
ncbi:alpha-1B-glycoprotein-like [Pelodytes ibericus]